MKILKKIDASNPSKFGVDYEVEINGKIRWIEHRHDWVGQKFDSTITEDDKFLVECYLEDGSVE